MCLKCHRVFRLRFLVNVSNSEDCFIFFFSKLGQEYPAIVEFAPFQKIAKKRSKKKDAKSGTIEDGEIYVYIFTFYF